MGSAVTFGAATAKCEYSVKANTAAAFVLGIIVLVRSVDIYH
jgi:hypothetical protein